MPDVADPPPRPPLRRDDPSGDAVPVLAYATPRAGKGIPRWVSELWSFFKIAAIVTMVGAFLLMLRLDGASLRESGHARFLMGFYLLLLAIGVGVTCLRDPFAALGWRLSTALAVPFVLWQASVVYVELAYMRAGWPWINVYAEARPAIGRTVVGLVWLTVSFAGFVQSRRRGRAASFTAKNPPPSPG